MDDRAEKITELIDSDQLTAAEMTHALKNLGEGSMQDGLKNMADYFKEEAELQYDEGKKDGMLQAIPIVIAVVGIIKLVKMGARKFKKWKEKKEEHKKHGEKILNEMKEAHKAEDFAGAAEPESA